MRFPPSGEAVAAASRAGLVALLQAARRTPFWASRLRQLEDGLGRGDANPFALLDRLSPVTKRELCLAGRAAVQDGWVRPWWPTSRSSGSTGEPFVVHFDLRGWVTLKYAVKLRARAACGVAAGDRIAVLDAFPVSQEGWTLPERVRPFRRISVLQPAELVAEKLLRHRPSAVYGLPSALLEAGQALATAGRRPPVRVVFASGEFLQPGTRTALAAAFDAPVLDVYGSSETKEIAWECLHGGRHINADVLHVEVVGPDGDLLPPGEDGEIVVSVLANHAMPMLRYRTGDRGYLRPGRCPCGVALPLLGVLSGREADTLDLGAGRRISPYLLTTAIEQIDGVLQYQVSQTARSRLRVRAVPAAAADRALMDDGIRAALRREVEPTLDVDVEFVDRLPRGARAKVRAVEPLESETSSEVSSEGSES
jgi:phenylacetate-CoA ligase